MRSCSVVLGTISSDLGWSMMEDKVRKRMYVYACDWVTLLYSRKLTEHWQPSLMEKKSFKIKKISSRRWSHGAGGN